MLKEFKLGQQDYMILSVIDVSAYKKELSASSYRSVLTIPFYHFRHKKHASMSEDVNQGLKYFTKTPAYNNYRKRYWLN
jgi:multiple sugar transport system substrate-binding protein